MAASSAWSKLAPSPKRMALVKQPVQKAAVAMGPVTDPSV